MSYKPHHGKKLPPGESCARSLFKDYARKGLERGHAFELSFEQFVAITSSLCYLCGSPPKQKIRKKAHNGDYTYNGIDRVDNTQGYILGNVMACCGTCNSIKSKLSLIALKKHLQKMISILEGYL